MLQNQPQVEKCPLFHSFPPLCCIGTEGYKEVFPCPLKFLETLIFIISSFGALAQVSGDKGKIKGQAQQHILSFTQNCPSIMTLILWLGTDSHSLRMSSVPGGPSVTYANRLFWVFPTQSYRQPKYVWNLWGAQKKGSTNKDIFCFTEKGKFPTGCPNASIGCLPSDYTLADHTEEPLLSDSLGLFSFHLVRPQCCILGTISLKLCFPVSLPKPFSPGFLSVFFLGWEWWFPCL